MVARIPEFAAAGQFHAGQMAQPPQRLVNLQDRRSSVVCAATVAKSKPVSGWTGVYLWLTHTVRAPAAWSWTSNHIKAIVLPPPVVPSIAP